MADYIERQDAIAELRKAIAFYAKHKDYEATGMLEIAIERINKVPSADVKPVVHGRWLKEVGSTMMINLENAREQYKVLGYPHRIELRLRCSNCNKITFVDASINYDFCPNCGADMRGNGNG